MTRWLQVYKPPKSALRGRIPPVQTLSMLRSTGWTFIALQRDHCCSQAASHLYAILLPLDSETLLIAQVVQNPVVQPSHIPEYCQQGKQTAIKYKTKIVVLGSLSA